MRKELLEILSAFPDKKCPKCKNDYRNFVYKEGDCAVCDSVWLLFKIEKYLFSNADNEKK